MQIADIFKIKALDGGGKGGGPQPTGTVEITENGIHDVAQYAAADVQVPVPSGTIRKTYAANGTYSEDIADYAEAEITVAIPLPDDVIFYDYDGTILYSYSAQDFLALTEMPPDPDRTSDGLEAQGWNWPLAEAQAYVRKYGALDVGQLYTPTSGAMEIDVELTDQRTPTISLALTGDATIEWGDGTSTGVTGTYLQEVRSTHEYASPGTYTIRIFNDDGTVMAGSGSFNNSKLFWDVRGPDARVYHNAVKRIRVCPAVGLGDFCFEGLMGLESVSMPREIQTRSRGPSFGTQCYALKHLTPPVTSSPSPISLPNTLRTIALPYGMTTWDSGVAQRRVTVPDSVTVATGSTSIPEQIVLPDSITSGTFTLYNNKQVSHVRLPAHMSTLGNNVLGGCYALRRAELPTALTALPTNCFNGCASLPEITIPDTVTVIGAYAFSGCLSLQKVTIPASVTEIQNYAFERCLGVLEYHLQPTTPPALASLQVFSNRHNDCVFFVPVGSLEAYQTATNWASLASYIREEPV